jgi:glycosyltransferase involved in cell wall biosynthesis
MSITPELISVVIPVRNRAELIPFQLEALANQATTRRFEVIVVDNGSTDDTVAAARSFADRFERFEVVAAADGIGCGYARNVGAPAARGELLVFCDSDDVAHTAWLEAIAQAWEPGTLVAGRISPLGLARDPAGGELPPGGRPRGRLRGFLPYADGCNMAIGRQDFETCGGFDESFPFSEDIEISWRLQLAGLRFVDAPDAVIYKRAAPGRWNRFRQFHRWGKDAPLLYRRFRHQGLRRRSARDVARGWGALALHLVRAPFDERDRRLVVSQAGFATGLVVGSLRQRVLYT